MNVASCGLGINSVAGIIEATNRGIIFDEILFANTGRGAELGERKSTYAYLELFNRWLLKSGQPQCKILHSINKEGEVITLYEEVIKLMVLPAIVFGKKTCSQRFKAAPQDKFLNNNDLAKQTWGKGAKVTKWIFYDADEPERAKDYSDDKFISYYFLVENNLGRYECEQIIINSGLPLPPKSSCKFCPSMKPYQIIELYESEPSDFWEAIEMERIAINGGKMSAVKGLGRDWSWWDLIATYRYYRLLRRNPQTVSMSKKMKSMIKRINRSRPVILSPRKTATETACDLFTSNINIPCGCYDNAE